MAETQALNVGVRGLVFTIFADWLKAKQGEERFEEIKKGLQVESLELLASAQKGKWYPLQHLVALLEFCGQGTDSSQGSWLEFGSYLCEVSLTTSFKGLIVFIDPVTLMKRMPLFWRRYFNAGDMSVQKVSSGEALLVLGESVGRGVIPAVFEGWLKHALKMVGATGIEVQGSDCRWQLSWTWSDD